MTFHSIKIGRRIIRLCSAALFMLAVVSIAVLLSSKSEFIHKRENQPKELIAKIPDSFVEEVFQASQISTDDIFIYKSYGNKSCALVAVSDKSITIAEIPSQSPDGDTIIEISENAFSGCSLLISVTISEDIREIAPNAFSECESLAVILTSSSNPSFCSVGGVLHNKDKTELICYPINSSRESYLLNSTVKRIGSYAFYKVKNLKSVFYEGSTEDFESIYVGLGNDIFKKLPITCNYCTK